MAAFFEFRFMATLADEVFAAPDGFTPWLQIYLREYSDLIFNDA